LGATVWIRDIAQFTAPIQVEAEAKGNKLVALVAYFANGVTQALHYKLAFIGNDNFVICGGGIKATHITDMLFWYTSGSNERNSRVYSLHVMITTFLISHTLQGVV
jgi:hypothetical protein